MATHRSARADNRRADIEQILDAHGIKWQYQGRVPLDEIRRYDDSQSRVRATDQRLVKEYTEKMARGAVFPPIVIWADGYTGYGIVDGNSRTLAKRNRGESEIDAYVIDVADANEAIYVSAIFNATHGQKLSKDEVRRAIIAAGRTLNPPTAQRLAQDYGLPVGIVSRIQNVYRMDTELKALGLEPERVSEAARYTLSRLTDTAVKQGLYSLIADSGMPQAEVATIAKEIQAQGSEADRLKIIADARTERAPQIRATAAGRHAPRTPNLSMPLGQLLSLRANTPDLLMLVPIDPAKRADQAVKVAEVVKFLGQVAEAFRAGQTAETAA